jgi:hypothetical protein
MKMGSDPEEYDKIRFWLFTETYVASEIVVFLRQKYKIPQKMSPVEWWKRIIREHWNLLEHERKRWEATLKRRVEIDSGFLFVTIPKIEREIIPEIPKLASKLHLNEHLLKVFILYNNVPNKLYPLERLFFASPLSPITDLGYYIKVDEHLTEREMLSIFREVRQKTSLFSDPVEARDKTKYEQRRRKQFGKDDDAKILAFVSVEKEIKNISERGLIYDNEDKEQVYRRIIEMAIGEVVQHTLDKLKYDDEKQDKVFGRWQKRITTYYYVIARRYNLPTPKKLNAILRLMQS